MGLVERSRHSGLSPARPSKLEHGKLYLTLATPSHIALVFNVDLDHFFSDEKNKHTFARAGKKDRLRFPEAPDLGPSLSNLNPGTLRYRS
jgi:transcriptional regulator with XRE-family HTH domain